MSFDSIFPDYSRADFYPSLQQQAEALLSGETDRVANAANLAALLYHSLPDINWAGFYFLHDGQLVLGPFQGMPACVRIPVGRGVCGTAARTVQTQVVPDVHKFEGHIACDSASNSEIVVPLVLGGELIGVLDIDSPRFDRFGARDRLGLEQVALAYLRSLT